jgi:uracil-DNA glycosylase
MMNLGNAAGMSSSQLKSSKEIESVIDMASRGTKVVALGRLVHEVLEKHKVPHLYMPHPSGLCRFWNDKELAAKKIEEFRSFVRGET